MFVRLFVARRGSCIKSISIDRVFAALKWYSKHHERDSRCLDKRESIVRFFIVKIAFLRPRCAPKYIYITVADLNLATVAVSKLTSVEAENRMNTCALLSD